MWHFKCRECGSEFEENENLPMKLNPSDIMQEVCPKCGGAFTHEFRPTPRAVDGGQAGDSSGQLALPTATNA